MGGKKKLNSRSNTGNQEGNYTQNEPPDPPDPPDRATRSRTRAKMEGADESTTQTDDARPPSAERSDTRTTSEVEETPSRQTSLREDTPAEDLAPIARNTNKGKGKYIPPNSEDDHDALLSPQGYERPRTSTTDHILNLTSIPTSARYSSTLHSPIEIDDSPRWIKMMISELGKVIVTMSRETERHKERYRKEMRNIFKEIAEQMDRCEERHQSDLHDILRMFSEENSKRECRFYADLLNQQGRASAEINVANAMNTEFLRGLQEAMLGVIVTTIQQRQGINV